MYMVYIEIDSVKHFTGRKHKTLEEAEREKTQLEKGGYKYQIEKKEDNNVIANKTGKQ